AIECRAGIRPVSVDEVFKSPDHLLPLITSALQAGLPLALTSFYKYVVGKGLVQGIVSISRPIFGHSRPSPIPAGGSRQAECPDAEDHRAGRPWSISDRSIETPPWDVDRPGSTTPRITPNSSRRARKKDLRRIG